MNSKLSAFLSHLFVDKYNCILCDRELRFPSRYHLCPRCYGTFEAVGERACLKCGRMLLSGGEYCVDCKNHDLAFDRAFSPVTYASAAAFLVTSLKFHGKRYFAAPMGRWMTDRLLEEEIAVDTVLPVPLHQNREKERGYNQSELLAKTVAEGLKLPLDTTTLLREKDTLASSSLEGGREAREKNVKDAFRVTSPENVKEKVVLLVDDVLTTGATSSEIARVLKKAGAKKVYVLTFAATREPAPLQTEG